jgi:hypothetical protein
MIAGRRAAVPSFNHDFLVKLFHDCTELAPSLLGACAKIAIDHDRAEDRSIDLTQVTSTEFRADAVVILENQDRRPVAGLVIEVQIDDDDRKRFSWPSYVTTLRAKYQCQTMLLVLAPNRAVERWARRPIEIGHPGFCLTPIVIGFRDVPRIQNGDDAARMPELAVLSTLAHPELEIARATIFGIEHLPPEQKELYMDVIMSVVPATVRQRLEVDMESCTDHYRSEWVHKFVVKGREEGRQEGLEEGRQEGRQEGRDLGQRDVVLMIARAKLKKLTDKELAAIDRIDPRRLAALVTSLAKARTVTEARMALKRIRTRQAS